MSDGSPNPETITRPRRWPKILLAVSLFFNLMVLGVVAGAHLREGHEAGGHPPPDRSAIRTSGFAPFFDALPREARGEIGRALRAQGDGGRPDRAVLEAEFAAIVAALRADPFEPSALEGVMAAQQARVSLRVEAGRAALLDVLAAMSPAERAAFADQLERRLARGERAR